MIYSSGFCVFGHEMAKIGKKYIKTRRMIYFTKTKCLGWRVELG